MDGLQVSTDSPKYVAHTALPTKPYSTKSPVGVEELREKDLAANEYPETTTRNPFGLGAFGFGLLIGVITCIVTAAIVGGAVGGALNSKHNTSGDSSCAATTVISTTTATATVSATATPTSGLVNNYEALSWASVNTTYFPYCPNQNEQTISTVSGGDSYLLQCGRNQYGTDAMVIVAYSVEDCIQACTNVNTFNTTTNCVGVNYWAMLEQSFYNSAGNCWLKNNLTYTVDAGNVPQLSAILQ